jgi:hypothetical protein
VAGLQTGGFSIRRANGFVEVCRIRGLAPATVLSLLRLPVSDLRVSDLPDLARFRAVALDDRDFAAGFPACDVALDCVARTMAFTSESLLSERHRSTRCRLAIERNSFNDLAFNAAAVITYRFSQVQGA